jgi:hypothetical protein
MRFDDRLGDRQTETHAGLPGGEEAVEQALQMLGVDAGAAVSDDAAYRPGVLALCSDGDAPARRFRSRQRLAEAPATKS